MNINIHIYRLRKIEERKMEKIEIVLGCTYLNARFNNVTKLLSQRQIPYCSTSNRKIATEHCNICIVDDKFNGAIGLRPDVSFGLSKNSELSLPKHIVIDYSHGYNISFIDFVEAIEKKIPSPYVYRFGKDYIINAAIDIAKDRDLYTNMFMAPLCSNGNKLYGAPSYPQIKKVIFNNPATIVLWTDGTKSVVKAYDEEFDKEKGLAMAVSKKMLGTNDSESNYYDEFKKWITEDEEEDNVKCFDHSMAKMAEKINKASA